MQQAPVLQTGQMPNMAKIACKQACVRVCVRIREKQAGRGSQRGQNPISPNSLRSIVSHPIVFQVAEYGETRASEAPIG
jgi:hypothetical protein